MIDFHSHILPLLDDGSRSWDESLEMARIAAADGITEIVCTPHYKTGWISPPVDVIAETTRVFQARLCEAGIPVRVHQGTEAGMERLIVDKVRRGRIATLGGGSAVGSSRSLADEPRGSVESVGSSGRADGGESIDTAGRAGGESIDTGGRADAESTSIAGRTGGGESTNTADRADSDRLTYGAGQTDSGRSTFDPGRKRYLLLELPWTGFAEWTLTAISELVALGVVPVIAHAERYHETVSDPDLVRTFVEQGALVQVNSGSITGFFGDSIKHTAEVLLTHRLAHVIGSDAHSAGSRCPRMAQARAMIADLLGEDDANQLTRLNASRILAGETVPREDPLPIAGQGVGRHKRLLSRIRKRA